MLNGALVDNILPDAMLNSLKGDIYLFSALRTHAQLFEASRLLLTDEGRIKPYSQFQKEIAKIKENYRETYLEAEYQFAVSSAQMAGKWAEISPDYDIQYRTAMDDRVRDSHKELHGITLPPSDAFWMEYYPPNGWRCRCTALEVRKGKYDVSNSADAIKKGEAATTQLGKDGKNRLAIFRFNPGAQKVIFPPDHPYNKVAGADVLKADFADTSHLDAKVFRFTGWDEVDVKYKPFYKAALEIAPNMRPAEALGINRYTGSDFSQMNKYLRNGRKPPKGNLDALIGVTDSGLAKLPSYKGITYRGARLEKEILDKYENAFKTGTPHIEDAYMSTSADPTKKFDGNAVFVVNGKNGKYVKPLSEFESEEEVLFKHNSQFKVTSFVRNDKGVEIVLEEI